MILWNQFVKSTMAFLKLVSNTSWKESLKRNATARSATVSLSPTKNFFPLNDRFKVEQRVLTCASVSSKVFLVTPFSWPWIHLVTKFTADVLISTQVTHYWTWASWMALAPSRPGVLLARWMAATEPVKTVPLDVWTWGYSYLESLDSTHLISALSVAKLFTMDKRPWGPSPVICKVFFSFGSTDALFGGALAWA